MSKTAPEERAMSDIYDDFTDFADEGNVEKAKECISHMKEYSEFESERMEKELEARLEEKPV